MARKEPQNIEAEINALGCAFLSKSALDKVCEELTTQMFYLDSHKKIFEALISLRSTDTAVDITTVSNELEKNESKKNESEKSESEKIDSTWSW